MSTIARISTAEFERMIEGRVFDEEVIQPRRIELIYGELRELMVPPNPPHEGTVDWLNRWSILNTDGDKVAVRVQNTLGIPALDSMPVPDLAWMRANKNYRRHRPLPEDVLLIIEVSDTSLSYDLKRKAELYAEAGLTDYWVVDVNALVVHVHRDPVGNQYQSIEILSIGQEIRPLADDSTLLHLSDLFVQ